MNVSTFIRRHQLGTFFMLVFVVAWGLNAADYFTLPTAGPPAHISDVPLPRLLLLLLGTAASTATGFTLTRVVGGKEGIRELLGRFNRWRVGFRRYAVAIFTASVPCGWKGSSI